MPTLTCFGADGQSRTFNYTHSFNQLDKKWEFLVHTIPPPASGEFFQLSLTAVDPQTVRITEIDAHDKSLYGAKGIPDALLPAAAAVLKKTIVSSPTTGGAGVSRNSDATKMW